MKLAMLSASARWLLPCPRGALSPAGLLAGWGLGVEARILSWMPLFASGQNALGTGQPKWVFRTSNTYCVPIGLGLDTKGALVPTIVVSSVLT